MLSAGIEPAIPEIKPLQTYILDLKATRIGNHVHIVVPFFLLLCQSTESF